MNELNPLAQSHYYDVSVGFHRVRVEGNSPAEAILVARRQLCTEHPRMWDVFAGLAEQRFSVEQVIR
jgi:hypothetical protein